MPCRHNTCPVLRYDVSSFDAPGLPAGATGSDVAAKLEEDAGATGAAAGFAVPAPEPAAAAAEGDGAAGVLGVAEGVSL